MALVRYTWVKQEPTFRIVRRSNFVSPIGWCLVRFQRYDGTLMLLMARYNGCYARAQGATAGSPGSLARSKGGEYQ